MSTPNCCSLDSVLQILKNFNNLTGPNSVGEKEKLFLNLIESTKGAILKLFDKKGRKKFRINEATYHKACAERASQRYSLSLEDLVLKNSMFEQLEGSGSTGKKINLLTEILEGVSEENLSAMEDFYTKGTFRIGFDQKAILRLLIKSHPQRESQVKHIWGLRQDQLLYYAYQELLGQKISFQGLKYKPMLASNKDLPKETFTQYVAEPKYDGVRILIRKVGGKVLFWTRSGEQFYTQNLLKVLPKSFIQILNRLKDCVLDGELWISDLNSGEGFRKLLPLIRTKTLGHFPHKVKIKIFDVLQAQGESTVDMSYVKRRTVLKSFNLSSYLIKAWKIENLQHVHKVLLWLKGTAIEGLVLKKLRSTYEPGKRSINWIKVKRSFDNLDLLVSGWLKGSGKYSNLYSSFQGSVRLDGQYVDLGYIGSGFTEQDLIQLKSLVDKGTRVIFQVSCEGLMDSPTSTSGYAMRFPHFKRIRYDLSEPNSLQEALRIYRKSFI